MQPYARLGINVDFYDGSAPREYVPIDECCRQLSLRYRGNSYSSTTSVGREQPFGILGNPV
jgi:hypothetical protein